MNEDRAISVALVNNLLNYLQTQPYGQVYQLINQLMGLQPISRIHQGEQKPPVIAPKDVKAS